MTVPNEVADFDGWATVSNVKCSDGRIIAREAFEQNDGGVVPLVWQHGHDNVTNVLGHAQLEKKPEGVYAYGFFNGSAQAEHARELIEHGDVTAMSIFANHLKQEGNIVRHGNIVEVSLVLKGANPKATIENVSMAHSDGDGYAAIIKWVTEMPSTKTSKGLRIPKTLKIRPSVRSFRLSPMNRWRRSTI